jgi:hypothetical protein
MADGHGGARPNSGRKLQSANIRKVDPAVINAGILPLEMRLKVARKMWAEAVDAEGEIVDLEKAQAAANFAEPALPYTSPRLNSVEHSGPDGGAIEFARIERVIVDPAPAASD